MERELKNLACFDCYEKTTPKPKTVTMWQPVCVSESVEYLGLVLLPDINRDNINFVDGSKVKGWIKHEVEVVE